MVGSHLRTEGSRDRWGVLRASGRCRLHYRSLKGGSVCLQVLGVRRAVGARVKEGCSEGVAFVVGLDKQKLGGGEGTQEAKATGGKAQRS